jgi:4'-phosphopantetheinyl transferase
MVQLDTAERTRAQRFAFPHLRTRFVAAHVFVRQVLGEYLNIAPECVRYTYTAQGKPRLSNGGKVRFNLSHSADLVAVAIARNREIGIDIEKTHQIADMLNLARRYFSRPEIDWLLAMPQDA